LEQFQKSKRKTVERGISVICGGVMLVLWPQTFKEKRFAMSTRKQQQGGTTALIKRDK
jgi:hypothetical protein